MLWNELKPRIAKHRHHVVARTGKVIVHADYLAAPLEQSFAKVGAEKARVAGD
jgi:hypothetical protein